MPKHENAKIVVFGRRPQGNPGAVKDVSWCDNNGEVCNPGVQSNFHNIIDFAADSVVLNQQASATNCRVIIVCREKGQSDVGYDAVCTRVHTWNNTRREPVPIIEMNQNEAEHSVRVSSNARLNLPKEVIVKAIQAVNPVQPPQRTWSEFRDQCLPKMPASLGIVEALSSAATMALLKLKSWSSPASYTKLSKDVTEVKDSTAKEASVSSCMPSFKDFVSWAHSKMPWADKDKGIEMVNKR